MFYLQGTEITFNNHSEIRTYFGKDNIALPSVITGQNLDSLGVQSVVHSIPEPNDYIKEVAPVFIDGVLTQQWESRPYNESELAENKAAADKAAKMTGVEFNGVMYSATAEDQWGLASIKDEVANGMTINYEYKNGSMLAMTTDNWAPFKAVWVPFRQSFFL